MQQGVGEDGGLIKLALGPAVGIAAVAELELAFAVARTGLRNRFWACLASFWRRIAGFRYVCARAIEVCAYAVRVVGGKGARR